MRASTPWITYRTRFLVKAKQLTTSLTFADVLGRQHSGRKGDYLVESADGSSPHRSSPDLRRHLCTPHGCHGENAETVENFPRLQLRGGSDPSCKRTAPSKPLAPSAPNPQISPTLPQRSQPQPKPALAVNPNPRPSVPRDFTDPWPLTPGPCLYERTMNSTCGKQIQNKSHNPAPRPSLLKIQPVVFTS